MGEKKKDRICKFRYETMKIPNINPLLDGILTGIDPSFPNYEPIYTLEIVRHTSQCIKRGHTTFVSSNNQTWTTVD